MTTGGAAVAETHSATVFFVGDRAYKLKKPVDLGFLDFRTRSAREAICHLEVALNRRLAPDVYLGVADVVGPDGDLCDHLVVMRRMPDDRRLAHLLEVGAPVDDHLRHIAHRLAAFHAASPRSARADDAAGIAATRHRWAVNTDALIATSGGIFDDATIGLVHGLACRYLDGRHRLFEERVADGRAVDGHGDLLADDIFCLDDGPRILDCIEFDESLRLGDALADAAFLAMDLERLGHPGLADRFLGAYREHTGDAWPASLAHHQVAYRAQVRAKVTAIRAAQGDPAAVHEAIALLDLALDHLEAGRVRLVVVGGLPGTGKSTLAAGLGAAIGGAVLRSDEVRKEQAGLDPRQPAPAPLGAGIYTDERTEAAYATMLGRAATGLARGETVVLDASWTDDRWRAEARRVAANSVADLVELRCTAPADVAAARMAHRQRVGGDPSDATPAVAEHLAGRAAPWPTATAVDTTGSAEHSLAVALAAVHHERRRRPSGA
jgi:aminoglycoside phosphotransferase family enzyme/predicted kinase